MNHRISALMIMIVTALLTSLGAGPAFAADNGAWSVTPTPPEGGAAAPRAYFILEGDPGSRIKDKVRLQNWTNKPITFKLYGADGYNTAQDGFFALRNFGDEMTDVGSWVTPVTSQVTVHGKTQVDVPVTIRIPRNATPGDHIGGVVAMNVEVESTGGPSETGVDVGIQRAVAARLYLRVSGPTAPALEVGEVRLEHDRGLLPWSGSGEGAVTYAVENTGNVRLSPQSVITLGGLSGDIETVNGEDLPELLPGQQVALRQTVHDVPAYGRVSVSVDVTTAEGPQGRASTALWLVPWPSLLLLLPLLGLARWWWRRRGLAQRRLESAAQAPQIMVTSDP